MCDIATDGIIFVRTDPDAREIGEYDSATKWERPINLDREVTKVKCGRERRRIWNRRVGIWWQQHKSSRVGSGEAENRSEVAFHLDHDIISNLGENLI